MQARVLVVDDETDNRESLAILLEADGFEVDQAPNGAVALALLEASNYDVLVTDIEMGPGMTGLELAAKVSRTVDPPYIIVVSGSANTPLACAAGACEYFRKPLDVEAFLDIF